MTTKKKKPDIATELADLLMNDEPGGDATAQIQQPTHSIKDSDPDPTIAISKSNSQSTHFGEKTQSKVGPVKSDETRAVVIDAQKSVVGYEIQQGIGSREQNLVSTKSKAAPADETLSTRNRDSTEFGKTKGKDSLSGVFPSSPHSEEPGSIKRDPRPRRASTEMVMSAEASLVQSEHLRIAQERISELENVVESLRTENEQLVAAGETLRDRGDEMRSQVEQLQNSQKEKQEIYNEELVVLRSGLGARTEEISKLRMKIDELESRLSGDLKKIRVRERELENRLEIVKLEGLALLKNKDEIILDHKRKIDQLSYEIENYRDKSRELNQLVDDNRDRIRRTVKALRLALSMLEGDEAAPVHLKKAE